MQYWRHNPRRRKISFIIISLMETVSLSNSLSWNSGVDRLTQVLQGFSFPNFPQFEDQTQSNDVSIYYRPSDNSLIGTLTFRFGNSGSRTPPTQEQQDTILNALRSFGIKETTSPLVNASGVWGSIIRKDPSVTMSVRGDTISLEILKDISNIPLIKATDIISLYQSEKGEYYNRLLRRSPISFSAKPKFEMVTEINTFGLRITAPFNPQKTDIEMVKEYLNRSVSDIKVNNPREAYCREKKVMKYASGMQYYKEVGWKYRPEYEHTIFAYLVNRVRLKNRNSFENDYQTLVDNAKRVPFLNLPQFGKQGKRSTRIFYDQSSNSLFSVQGFQYDPLYVLTPPTQEQFNAVDNAMRSIGAKEITPMEQLPQWQGSKVEITDNPSVAMKIFKGVLSLEITTQFFENSLIKARSIIEKYYDWDFNWVQKIMRKAPISFSSKPQFDLIVDGSTYGIRITAPFKADKTDIKTFKYYFGRQFNNLREANMRRKADGEYKLGPVSGMVRGLRYGEEDEILDEDLMAEFDPNEIGEETDPRSYGHFTQQEWGEISDIFYSPRMASSNARVHIDKKQLLETAKRRVESQLELTLISKKKAKKYSLKEYEKTWLNTKLFNPGNPIPSKIGDMVLKRNSNPHTFYYVQHHIIELVQPLKYEKSDGSAMTFEDRQLIADTLSSMIADDWGTMGSKNLYADMITDMTAEPSVDKGQNVLKLTLQGNVRLNMGSVADFFRQYSNEIFGANVSSVYLEYGRGELSFVGVLGKSASRMASDEHLADFYKESVGAWYNGLNRNQKKLLDAYLRQSGGIEYDFDDLPRSLQEDLYKADDLFEERLREYGRGAYNGHYQLEKSVYVYLTQNDTRSYRMAGGHLADSDGNYMSVQNIKEIQDMANFLAQQVHNGENMEDWVEDKISSARQMLSDLTRYYSNGEKEMKGLDNWKYAKKQDSATDGAEGYFADIPYLRETREFAQSGENTNDPRIDPKAQKNTPPTPSEIEQDDDVKTLGRVKVEDQSVKQDKKASATARLLAQWKCLGEE